MFCSTIIATVDRPTLARAVQTVLDQHFTAGDFEVIVVNDSGRALADAEWQHSPRARVMDTQKRERCVARNAGAAIARGRYLHFLDDDDWLLPGALQTLWDLAQTSDALWLYGGCQIVECDGNLLGTVHLGATGNVFTQVMAPRQWVPLQGSLIDADAFFAAGGFHPALLVTQTDTLCRQVLLHGNFAETMVPVACILRGSGWQTTTDYAHAEQYARVGRELNLCDRGVFSRMRASASSSFWHGRIVRMYLSSTVWNLRCRRGLTAASRAAFGLASFVLTGTGLLSRGFWRGVISKPESNAVF
jgi:glycosyltransferase involved in cell wall biosynthesis